MRPKVRKLLDSALREKNSPLFLSKNKSEIKKYFDERGIDVEEKELNQYLEEERSKMMDTCIHGFGKQVKTRLGLH